MKNRIILFILLMSHPASVMAQELRDIKGPVELPVNNMWLLALIVLIILAIGGLLWFCVRNRLAKSASKGGLKRFIYVSSIGVLGQSAPMEHAFNNNSIYAPKEPYAISKMEAEVGLKVISESTGMEVVIVRPPLVYGPAAPGNFQRLLKLVDTGLPLPLARLNAIKSMISLENLCDLLVRTVSTPLPKFSKFVVSDGSDWSTADLVRLIAKYMDRRQSLFPVPVPLLKAVAAIVGRSEDIHKLAAPLVVDGSETAKVLGWSPVQSPEDGVRKAVEFYLANK